MTTNTDPVRALPIETAPRDGTIIRLLVEFEDHATEDTEGPAWTIGHNSRDNTGDDVWQFAGWCWNHDHYTEGKGKPVGWLPLVESSAPPSAPAGVDVELRKICSWKHLMSYSESYFGEPEGELKSAVYALERALAQQPAAPSGEAVAWIAQCELDSLAATPEGLKAHGLVWSTPTGQAGVPLYAAPQQPAAPSGEAVGDDERKREAWSDFDSEFLTDGNGYAPAPTYAACFAAFEAAWPDAKAAHAAAKAEYVRLHPPAKHAAPQQPAGVDEARPLDDWHEDDGPVVWWTFPVNEPAWIGSPTDSDWPGYHTHWTPHPAVPPTLTAQQKGDLS